MPIVWVDRPTIENGRSLFTYVQLSGGAVLRVLREGDILYSTPGTAVDVHLLQRDTVVRAPGTVVALAGTAHRAVADSSSHALLENVLPGNYTVRMRAPLMERIDVPPTEDVLSVPADTAIVFRQLRLPGANDLVRAACGDTVVDDSAMVFGTVHDSHDAPLADATIKVAWFTMRDGPQFIKTESDSRGRWLVCSVPPQQDLMATVTVKKIELQRIPIRIPFRWKIVRFDFPSAGPQQP